MMNYKSYRANNILKSFEKGGPGSGPHKRNNIHHDLNKKQISEEDIYALQKPLSILKDKYRSMRRKGKGHYTQHQTEEESKLWNEILIKEDEIEKLRETYRKQNGY